MGAFRDDREALQHRVAMLERELEGRVPRDEVLRELDAALQSIEQVRPSAGDPSFAGWADVAHRVAALRAHLAGEPAPRRRPRPPGLLMAAGLAAIAASSVVAWTLFRDERDARCPDGAQIEELGEEAYRCTFGHFSLPRTDLVGHYCDYLDRGYFGFTWPLAHDRSYSCPSGMRWSENGSGTAFCVATRGPLEAGRVAIAECDRVRDGVIGYRVTDRAPAERREP